jgi:hypothetical protein
MRAVSKTAGPGISVAAGCGRGRPGVWGWLGLGCARAGRHKGRAGVGACPQKSGVRGPGGRRSLLLPGLGERAHLQMDGCTQVRGAVHHADEVGRGPAHTQGKRRRSLNFRPGRARTGGGRGHPSKTSPGYTAPRLFCESGSRRPGPRQASRHGGPPFRSGATNSNSLLARSGRLHGVRARFTPCSRRRCSHPPRRGGSRAGAGPARHRPRCAGPRPAPAQEYICLPKVVGRGGGANGFGLDSLTDKGREGEQCWICCADLGKLPQAMVTAWWCHPAGRGTCRCLAHPPQPLIHAPCTSGCPQRRAPGAQAEERDAWRKAGP